MIRPLPNDLQANQKNKPLNQLTMLNGWLNIQWKFHHTSWNWRRIPQQDGVASNSIKIHPPGTWGKHTNTKNVSLISHTLPLRFENRLSNRVQTFEWMGFGSATWTIGADWTKIILKALLPHNREMLHESYHSGDWLHQGSSHHDRSCCFRDSSCVSNVYFDMCKDCPATGRLD